MKKRVCFLGAIVSFLFCAVSVRADLIWEPTDSFYEEHASQCNYVNRSYTANGPDGVVILYESPESNKVAATWENGKKVWISYTYEDARGILWGICEEDETGWMPMEYMKVVYDHISFDEDYADEIISEDGALDEQYRNSTVYFYKYPAAEEYYSMDLEGFATEYMPGYTQVYTDETGHRWGKIGYFCGNRNVWVCLDAPTADRGALYPDGAPQIGEQADTKTVSPEPGQQNPNTGRITPQTDNQAVIAAVILVVLAAAASAVLLVVLKKRGKIKKEN